MASDSSNAAWRLTVDEDGHFVCHGWLGPDEMTPKGWRQIEVVAVDALFDAPALTAAADALLKPAGQRVNTVRGRAVGDAQQIIKAAVDAVTGKRDST